MVRWRRLSQYLMAILLAMGLLGRIPLLFHGYGSDDDSWRNAVAGLRMHDLGRYVPSRIPGFPVYEGMLYLLQPLGWVATNGLSIIAGCLAALLLARIARRLGVDHGGWLALAFFLSAPLLVDTGQTMDYALGLMLFLLAYLLLLKDRLTASGVALAFAAGSRITLGFMAAPAILFLLLRRKSFAAVTGYVAIFLVSTLIVYSPMLLSAESRTLAGELEGHVAKHHATVKEMPGLVRLVTVFLWTKLGAVVLLVGLVHALALQLRGRVRLQERSGEENQEKAGLSALGSWFESSCILLLLGFFFLVPYEPAYVLPALPLGLLLLGRALRRGAFLALSVVMPLSLLVTPYVDIGKVGPGRYLQELELRRELLQRTADLASFRPAVPTVVLVPRFEIHRLLILDTSLERAEAAWAPFRASGVALWSSDRRRGYASELSVEQRQELADQGYQVMTRASQPGD